MAYWSRGLGMTLKQRFTSGTTHIPAYKPSTGSSLGAGNQVPDFQKFFKIKGNDPLVYLRGSNDKFIYRGFMTIALGGATATLVCLYMMATGTMPKKERTV